MGDPLRDQDRLAALRASGLAAGSHQIDFEPLLALATRLLGAPVGLVSVVDDEGQHFAAELGLAPPGEPMGGTPLSHSFCKFVVVDDEPLVVSDARQDERLRDHPAIRDLGVIAYAGVPIRDGEGHVLGSFCAIDGNEHEWTGEDLEVLRILADAVSSRVSIELRHAQLIRSLQRHVLPDASAGSSRRWHMDAAYRPATRSGVGGDFYDVEAAGDGSLDIVLGDTVGHGLTATVAMAQLQAAARTARTLDLPLSETAAVLDRAAMQLDGVPYSGLILAHFDAEGQSFEHLCCGAIPPLVVRADGSAHYCEEAQTPPLAFPGARRTSHHHHPADLAGVVFVTDGLVERRGETLDVGMGRLADRAASAMQTEDPAMTLADELGAGSADDVAVVVVRPVR